MKSCPTCNRTFEDTFTFCLVDGSILSAPFDPQATLVLPINQTKNIPLTEASHPEVPIMPIQEATITSAPPGIGPGHGTSHRQELRLKSRPWFSLAKIVVGTIVG